jgi:hypothetical protein
MQSNPYSLGDGVLGWFAISLLITVFWLIPYWRICSRTGLSKWMLLALLVPFLGWLIPWFIAFAKWPKLDLPYHTDLAQRTEKDEILTRP